MIFNYPNKKFIEDGRPSRLLIEGFSFSQRSAPAGIANMAAINGPPQEEDSFITVLGYIEFVFDNGILRVMSEGKRITNISKLLFIMSESEISAAQTEMHRKNMDSNNEAVSRNRIFTTELKEVLQKAIDQLAIQNGIVLPENINFFNDKLILYMFPLLRTLTNSSTNFHKILEDVRHLEHTYCTGYKIPHQALEQFSLVDAVKAYLGTSSKEIIKFIGNNIIKKTDLVKSLSPQLLDILVNHSEKIFTNSEVELPKVKILTCYEDVILEVLTYVKFVMDIFKNNIDHTQRFLRLDTPDGFRTSAVISKFLSENLTPQKIFSLFGEEYSNQGYLIDIANQWNTYKNPESIPSKLRHEYPNGLELPRFQTLKELHDKVSTEYNKIKAEDNNKTIPYSELEWKLHGLKKDNVELILPSEGSTLVQWGKEQSHCVASYAERAARKDCLIIGVKIHGKMLYTLEVTTHAYERPVADKQMIVESKDFFSELPGTFPKREVVYSYDIRQFHGYGNVSPESYGDSDLRNTVKELLGSVFTANAPNIDQSNVQDYLLDALRYAVGGQHGLVGANNN